jgi:pimeloyl-ACP methyl ester carboxylesterase
MYDSGTRAPQEIVDDLERMADRFETPSGDGVMVWRAWGEGVPLLLLHGAGGGWTHWIRNIPHLAARRRVIAPDLPGYGDSTPPRDTETAWPVAEVIADGLRRLGFGAPLDVAGFSLGAVLAANLAARRPELVRRLVIVAAGGLDTPQNPMTFQRLSGLAPEARAAATRHNLLQLMLHADESADELAMYLQTAKTSRGHLDPQKLVLPDKLLAVLPKVRAQVDLIWGEFDRPHPDPELQARVVRRSHPDATLRVVRGAGHWAMFEGAEEFNRFLDEILDSPLRRV